MDNEENTTEKHECSGDDCQHEEHKTEAPKEDMSSCKACSGEEGAEHTCSM